MAKKPALSNRLPPLQLSPRSEASSLSELSSCPVVSRIDHAIQNFGIGPTDGPFGNNLIGFAEENNQVIHVIHFADFGGTAQRVQVAHLVITASHLAKEQCMFTERGNLGQLFRRIVLNEFFKLAKRLAQRAVHVALEALSEGTAIPRSFGEELVSLANFREVASVLSLSFDGDHDGL